MDSGTKASKSLLVLLLTTAVVMIFPALDKVALTDDEMKLADLAKQFISTGVTDVFIDNGTDFVANFYSYLVSLLLNNFNIPLEYATRLPSAIIITILAVSLYIFQIKNDKLSNSFLSSILFISSYTVITLAYHASPIAIMVLPIIATLAILYLYIVTPTRNKAILLILFCSAATINMGILAPVFVTMLGIGSLFIKGVREYRHYLKLAFYVIVSVIVAYGTILFITNDSTIAENVLGIEQITRPLASYPKFEMFANHVLFSIFPWSIPIIISFLWMLFNLQWIKDRFPKLSPYKRFGLIIFIISLPSLFVLNRLSLIMLMATIFFNMPIISGFLLTQIQNHTIIWRITGYIFASLIAIFTLLFIATRFGMDITFANVQITTTGTWSIWSTLLVIAIAIGLYTLSRNQRTIKMDNRYLYNIVFLYILVEILYKAYINPYLIYAL